MCCHYAKRTYIHTHTHTHRGGGKKGNIDIAPDYIQYTHHVTNRTHFKVILGMQYKTITRAAHFSDIPSICIYGCMNCTYSATYRDDCSRVDAYHPSTNRDAAGSSRFSPNLFRAPDG